MLIAAASTAREQESEQQEEAREDEGVAVETRTVKEVKELVEDGGGRKMKSLAILCKK